MCGRMRKSKWSTEGALRTAAQHQAMKEDKAATTRKGRGRRNITNQSWKHNKMSLRLQVQEVSEPPGPVQQRWPSRPLLHRHRSTARRLHTRRTPGLTCRRLLGRDNSKKIWKTQLKIYKLPAQGRSEAPGPVPREYSGFPWHRYRTTAEDSRWQNRPAPPLEQLDPQRWEKGGK